MDYWARHEKLQTLLGDLPVGLREQIIHVIEYAETATDAAREGASLEDLKLRLAAVESQLGSLWAKLNNPHV